MLLRCFDSITVVVSLTIAYFWSFSHTSTCLTTSTFACKWLFVERAKHFVPSHYARMLSGFQGLTVTEPRRRMYRTLSTFVLLSFFNFVTSVFAVGRTLCGTNSRLVGVALSSTAYLKASPVNRVSKPADCSFDFESVLFFVEQTCHKPSNHGVLAAIKAKLLP